MAFALHPRLATGGFEIGQIAGCLLLLKDNALFPWLLLVPEVEGIEDLHELPLEKYHEVMTAVRHVSEFMYHYFEPEKLNVACIGNEVRQMHIHIVARSLDDSAWPGTVWVHDGKERYAPSKSDVICAAARAFLDIPSPIHS